MTYLSEDRRKLRLRLPALAVLFFLLGHIFISGLAHTIFNSIGVVMICTALVWLFVSPINIPPLRN
jgi:hypothetical protein